MRWDSICRLNASGRSHRPFSRLSWASGGPWVLSVGAGPSVSWFTVVAFFRSPAFRYRWKTRHRFPLGEANPLYFRIAISCESPTITVYPTELQRFRLPLPPRSQAFLAALMAKEKAPRTGASFDGITSAWKSEVIASPHSVWNLRFDLSKPPLHLRLFDLQVSHSLG